MVVLALLSIRASEVIVERSFSAEGLEGLLESDPRARRGEGSVDCLMQVRMDFDAFWNRKRRGRVRVRASAGRPRS